MPHRSSLLFLILAVAGTGTPVVAQNQHQKEHAHVLQWPKGLPIYDHVVIVLEENKDYEQIIGNSSAPYINGVLRAEGANLTQMFGEEHYSQGNYYWLFCGSNLDIGFDDKIPSTPFQVSNLAQQLIEKGLTFKGYCEDLPAIGSTVAYVNQGREHIYGRKHVPWISFGNVPNGPTAETSCNLRWKDFPTNPAHYGELPTVSIVVPNLRNDMHNGPNDVSIPLGDAWLKQKIDPYYQWAKTHNSLLIITFDENDDQSDYFGLTNPAVHPTDPLRRDLQNRTATLLAGAHIKHGDYREGKGVTHVNLLRTLEAMYGLPKSGHQQGNAAGVGIRDDYLITDVFQPQP